MNIILSYVAIIVLLVIFIWQQEREHRREIHDAYNTIEALKDDLGMIERKCDRMARQAAWNFSEANHLRESLGKTVKELRTAEKMLETIHNS